MTDKALKGYNACDYLIYPTNNGYSVSTPEIDIFFSSKSELNDFFEHQCDCIEGLI